MRKLLLFTPLLLLLMIASASAQPTLPTGTVAYVNLTLNESWSSVVSPYVQQSVTINQSNYTSEINYNGSIANFEITYANGTVVPAWIESNQSNQTLVWLNITNTTTNVYLDFFNMTTNMLNSTGTNGIGEAPQLSSTYAEYDDGASVFTNYWNFAGTSLPSGWTSTTDFTGSVNNGLTVTSSSSWAGVASGAITASPPIILDAYEEVTSEQAATICFSLGTSFSSTYSYYDSYQYYQASSTSYTYAAIQYATGAGQTGVATGTLPIASNTGYNVYSAVFTSSSVAQLQNYVSVASASTTDLSSASYVFASVYTGATQEIQWMRTRAYPPNGVMPSVSFGAVQSAFSASIKQQSPQTQTYNGTNKPTINFTVTTGSAPFSFNVSLFKTSSLVFNSLFSSSNTTEIYPVPKYFGAGNYTINASVSSGSSVQKSSFDFNVIKANPALSLSDIPSNYTYNGTGFSFKYLISSFNNQLTGNLIISNTTEGTGLRSGNYIGVGTAGVYNITLLTNGNGNYTSNTIKASFTILKAAPAISMQLTNPAGTLTETLTKSGQNASTSIVSPITISEESKTLNSQVNTSLYIFKLINGKKAFTNGTIINSTNQKLVKPNASFTYYHSEEYTLSQGTYEFLWNSTGNQNYTGFDPDFIVNITGEEALSTGGASGGSSTPTSVVSVVTTAVNKTSQAVSTALNIPVVPGNLAFIVSVSDFYNYETDGLPIWAILAAGIGLGAGYGWYKNKKWWYWLAFADLFIIIVFFTLPVAGAG